MSNTPPGNPLELAASLMPVALSKGRLNELMEAVRLFALRPEEGLILAPGEGEETLRILSGRVRVEEAGVEAVRRLSAERGGEDRLALAPGSGRLTVLAESAALVCHIDQERLDFLLLWESLGGDPRGC